MSRMIRFLDRIARMVRPLSIILGAAGLLAGIVLIGGCSISAGWPGALMGVGAFLVILVFVIMFVGSIYLLTRMSDDLCAIRAQVEASKAPSTEASDRSPESPE